MVERILNGGLRAIAATPTEVAAARLQLKRAQHRGDNIDPAIQAIADAVPVAERPDGGAV